MDFTQIIIITIIIIIAIKWIADLIKKEESKKNKNENNNNENNNNTKIENEFKYKSKMLLTRAEYKFFMSIRPICEDKKIIICPKVRLEDFIETTATGAEYNRYRNMIKSRHVDFLLTDYDLNIVAAIELDDYTHNYAGAKITDDFKNKVYEKVKIPLFRININDNYEEAIIKIINFHEGMKMMKNNKFN